VKVAAIWREPIEGYDPWRSPHGAEFDPKVANRVCRFIERNVRHSKGKKFAGKLLKLERWEKKIIGHLFGWKRQDGTRRYRKIFILIPRKNGKTFLASVLGLIMFMADDEPGAEVYCLAASVEQAALVFNEAASIVKQNEDFSAAVKIFGGYRTMKYEATQSYWKVKSSDAGTAHGLNPHAFIIDELHVQRKNDLMEAMETGVGNRRQPIGAYLTTSDYSGDSPCNRMVDYSRKVRDGGLDDYEFLPVLYEALPDRDDWKDEKVWRRVNPNLGVSFPMEFLRSQFRKALEEPACKRFSASTVHECREVAASRLPQQDKLRAPHLGSTPLTLA